MNKTIVQDMLLNFTESNDNKTWYESVLRFSCAKKADAAQCKCGFSEYGSLATWMATLHPELVVRKHPDKAYFPSNETSACCLTETMENRSASVPARMIVLKSPPSCTGPTP